MIFAIKEGGGSSVFIFLRKHISKSANSGGDGVRRLIAKAMKIFYILFTTYLVKSEEASVFLYNLGKDKR